MYGNDRDNGSSRMRDRQQDNEDDLRDHIQSTGLDYNIDCAACQCGARPIRRGDPAELGVARGGEIPRNGLNHDASKNMGRYAPKPPTAHRNGMMMMR